MVVGPLEVSEKFIVVVVGGWSSDNTVSKVQVPSPKSFQVLTLDLTFGLDFWLGLWLDNIVCSLYGWPNSLVSNTIETTYEEFWLIEGWKIAGENKVHLDNFYNPDETYRKCDKDENQWKESQNVGK